MQFDYLLKKWDRENFWLQRTAAKFSANIIGCWSICLRGVRACGDNLPKSKVFTVLFRRKHSEAVHQTKGGGWDKIMDLAVGKDEQVKLKIFAIPWFSLNI